MAGSLVKGSSTSTDLQWTKSAITLAVSSGGSDTATATRPNKILGGDYSAIPFATPQAALDAIPKGLNHDVIVRIGAGTFTGFVAHGHTGPAKLRIPGSKALATITSGVTSGTAGAGTSTTSMNKPAAAANWTVDDLRGKFLVITSGGGASGDSDFPTIRAIKDNTTTGISVDAITGMDDTSVFQIVDIATILTDAPTTPYGVSVRAGFVQNLAKVETTLLKVAEDGGTHGIFIWNSTSTTLDGIDMSATSGYAGSAYSCDEIFFSNVLLDGVFQPLNCRRVDALNFVIQASGQINGQYLTNHNVTADALGCTATAVKPQNIVAMTLGLNANDCDTVPLDAQNVHNFSLTGDGLIGTNSTPTRGALFSKGGQYVVTGATIAGSSSDQFEIEGRAGSWSELSGVNSGTYAARGTFLHWGTGYTVWQTKLRVEGGESGDAYDEFITNNMVIGGIVKHYGAWQFLDPAYKEITAFAGGGQASATVVGYHNTVVVTVATTGDSVRLLDDQIEISYAGGLLGSIANYGANACNVYPPATVGSRKIYLNGNIDMGANSPVSLPVGATAIWQTRNDYSYNLWILVNSYRGQIFDGLTVTTTITNGAGTTSSGNGTGSGVRGTGGATGAGVTGIGGATSGAGGVFTATAGNSNGVTATGFGTGAGITATGGASGAGGWFTGGGPSGNGVIGVYGTGPNVAGAIGVYGDSRGSSTSYGIRGVGASGNPTSGHGVYGSGGFSGIAGGVCGHGVIGVGGAIGSGRDTSVGGHGGSFTGGSAASSTGAFAGHGVLAVGGVGTSGTNTAGKGVSATGGVGLIDGGIGVQGTGGAGSTNGNGGAGGSFTGGAPAGTGVGGDGIQATAAGAGNAVTATATGGGFALLLTPDTTSPVRAAVRWTPQDAQPTGAHVIGDMYVGSTGIMYMCTAAGTPGTWTAFAAGASVGDVIGPGSSTDNALVRFDLATGKLIQNSTATLSDNANLVLSAVSGIAIDATSTGVNVAAIQGTGGASGWGVFGDAGSGGIGVTGRATGVGQGVRGESASGWGVLGVGSSNPSDAFGVVGYSGGNAGTYGVLGHGGGISTANSGVGVRGEGGYTAGTGVEGAGFATGAIGVHGTGGPTSGIGVKGTGTGAGAGVHASNTATGYALYVETDTTTPAKAPIHIDPQDAQPTGAHVVGDMYVDSRGVLMFCLIAGTPGTWRAVGTSATPAAPIYIQTMFGGF